MKVCLYCKKIINPPQSTENPYLISNFRFRKFCNNECLIKFNNQKKKESYITQDRKHDDLVKELNFLIKGHLPKIKTRKGQYTPDIILENIDYELEMYNKSHHLKNKAARWDESRKHVLVIGVSNISKTLFDDVYFFNDKKLIKVN